MANITSMRGTDASSIEAGKLTVRIQYAGCTQTKFGYVKFGYLLILTIGYLLILSKLNCRVKNMKNMRS